MPTDSLLNYRPPANPWGVEFTYEDFEREVDPDLPRTGVSKATAEDVVKAFDQVSVTGIVYAAAMHSNRNIVPEGDAHRDARALAIYALEDYISNSVKAGVAAALAEQQGDGR